MKNYYHELHVLLAFKRSYYTSMKLLNNVFLIFILFIIDFINNFTKFNLHWLKIINIVSFVCDHYLHEYKIFLKMLLLRSVLDPFNVKTVFDLAGKDISLYPKVVYCGQQHFRLLRIVHRYMYAYDATVV
jgi:hypothetical protein